MRATWTATRRSCRNRPYWRDPRETPVWDACHAGKVADSVVVLGIAQAAQQHRPGIACVPSRLVHANADDPVDHLLAGVRRWLWRHLRRHLIGSQFLEHQGPTRIVLDYRRHRGVGPEIELPCRRCAAMAHDAIACKKG